MDAKTAVKILRDKTITFEPPNRFNLKPMSIQRCEEISDFIEQQTKQNENMKRLIILMSTALEGVLSECDFINNATYENVDVDDAEVALSEYKNWVGGSGE